jgi:hypothetical protein
MESSPVAVPVCVSDPYWALDDYVRFTGHGSAEVRLWALTRLDELSLEFSPDVLRRRLRDGDDAVALAAVGLAGRRRVAGVADALLARLQRAEDPLGAACAHALAQMGDGRLVEAIRRRHHLPPEERDPRIWLALSILGGAEASQLLRRPSGASHPPGRRPSPPSCPRR